MEFLREVDRRKSGRPGVPEKTKDMVVQMYKNNMPIAMIVSNCGISRATVYKILRERTAVAYEEQRS